MQYCDECHMHTNVATHLPPGIAPFDVDELGGLGATFLQLEGTALRDVVLAVTAERISGDSDAPATLDWAEDTGSCRVRGQKAFMGD